MKSERNRKIVKLPQHPGIGIVDKSGGTNAHSTESNIPAVDVGGDIVEHVTS